MAGILKPIAALLVAAAPLASGGAFETEMLAAHNLVRDGVNVPPLTWSARLALAARKWAEALAANGRFEHQKHRVYGENLYEARGSEASPTRVVAAWAAESANYDYRSNGCNGVCGHYTQIVWRATREVGCAVVRKERRQVVVCEYAPPGNWQGERPW